MVRLLFIAGIVTIAILVVGFLALFFLFAAVDSAKRER